MSTTCRTFKLPLIAAYPRVQNSLVCKLRTAQPKRNCSSLAAPPTTWIYGRAPVLTFKLIATRSDKNCRKLYAAILSTVWSQSDLKPDRTSPISLWEWLPPDVKLLLGCLGRFFFTVCPLRSISHCLSESNSHTRLLANTMVRATI